MNAVLLEELKTALEKEHETLVAELKSVATPDLHNKDNWDATFPKFEPVENASHASTEEEADEVEEYEVRLGTEASLESRLLAVNHALERMGTGTYGICRTCKKEIMEDRMRANPAAETCVEHAK